MLKNSDTNREYPWRVRTAFLSFQGPDILNIYNPPITRFCWNIFLSSLLIPASDMSVLPAPPRTCSPAPLRASSPQENTCQFVNSQLLYVPHTQILFRSHAITKNFTGYNKNNKKAPMVLSSLEQILFLFDSFLHFATFSTFVKHFHLFFFHIKDQREMLNSI